MPLDEIDVPFEDEQISFDPSEMQSSTAASQAVSDEVKTDYRDE